MTLTLSRSQNSPDNYVKRHALIPFIQKLRELFHVEHYFWRAEAQENGNIHFHLVIDAYIDKSRVNYEWDLCQFNAGIIRERPIFSSRYHTASTRIEAIQGVNNVAGYVVKYVTKDEGGRKIFGRLWGASKKLKTVNKLQLEFDQEIAREITEYTQLNDEKVYINDFFVIMDTQVLREMFWMFSVMREYLESYLFQTYNELYI